MAPQRIPDPPYLMGLSICGLVPEWDPAATAGTLAAGVIGEASVLSALQRERLTVLREAIQRGAVTEFPVDRRQEFARWLVRKGRLSG